MTTPFQPVAPPSGSPLPTPPRKTGGYAGLVIGLAAIVGAILLALFTSKQ
jgi:hypothetical protein